MTKDLYTPKEVTEVRKLLYHEQSGECALSNVVVDLKDCHTDHSHDEDQYVRGVLHKQSNMALGKLEGLWVRYLKYWYPNDLPTFLRQAANYLDRQKDTRYRHPGWLKKVQTSFNSLKEKQKDEVLATLGCEKQSNGEARKKVFRKTVLSKKHGYLELRAVIETTKEKDKQNV